MHFNKALLVSMPCLFYVWDALYYTWRRAILLVSATSSFCTTSNSLRSSDSWCSARSRSWSSCSDPSCRTYGPGEGVLLRRSPTGTSRPSSPPSKVSFETSFHSKQPKLEPKLVLALSETKRLFRLFGFYIETESFFDWTETNRRPTEIVW